MFFFEYGITSESEGRKHSVTTELADVGKDNYRLNIDRGEVGEY